MLEVLEAEVVAPVCEPVAQRSAPVMASLDIGHPTEDPFQVGRDLVGDGVAGEDQPKPLT